MQHTWFVASENLELERDLIPSNTENGEERLKERIRGMIKMQ